MSLTSQAEIKRLARQLRIRFPGWKIEGLLLQDVNRISFKVNRNGQAARLHVVSFRPGDQASSANPQMNWNRRAESYLAWTRKLCAMQDCDALALPIRCAAASSILHGRVKTVFALQPELLPLDEKLHQICSSLEIAQMLHAVCHALCRCREEKIPHGELTRQHLMRMADGGYCLDGMLEPQRLDDFNQIMPAEASEIQQAALLIRAFATENMPDADNNQAAARLQRLIDRAAVREKSLTLQKMITELDEIMTDLTRHSTSAGMSTFRDVTDLFSSEDSDKTIGVKGKHAVLPTDLEMTVGVRVRSAAENSSHSEVNPAAEPDPNMTIGLRYPAYMPSHAAVQDEPDDDERTIVTQ